MSKIDLNAGPSPRENLLQQQDGICSMGDSSQSIPKCSCRLQRETSTSQSHLVFLGNALEAVMGASQAFPAVGWGFPPDLPVRVGVWMCWDLQVNNKSQLSPLSQEIFAYPEPSVAAAI